MTQHDARTDWRRSFALACWMVGSFGTVAVAQTPIPVTATSQFVFTASTDHSRTSAFGLNLVDRYELEVSTLADVVLATVNLGKPAPEATSNDISVPVGDALLKQLIANTQYHYRAIAVGPGGAGRSLPSVPFGVPGPVGLPAAPTGLRVVP